MFAPCLPSQSTSAVVSSSQVFSHSVRTDDIDTRFVPQVFKAILELRKCREKNSALHLLELLGTLWKIDLEIFNFFQTSARPLKTVQSAQKVNRKQRKTVIWHALITGRLTTRVIPGATRPRQKIGNTVIQNVRKKVNIVALPCLAQAWLCLTFKHNTHLPHQPTTTQLQ